MTTTISATLSYADRAQGNAVRPIRRAKVEVWRYKPRGVLWLWGHDRTLTTDEQGAIRTTFDYEMAGYVYALRVVAENEATWVKPNPRTVGSWIPSVLRFDGSFWREPGDNNPIQPVANSPGQNLTMSWTFSGWSAQHFNIADTILQLRDFVNARRSVGVGHAADPLGRVGVEWWELGFNGTPYYNPVFSAIKLPSGVWNGGDAAFDDPMLSHEYAHFLQHHLSSFYALPSSHNGCDGIDAEHAWMEGFADFFEAAVFAALAPGSLSGTSAAPELSPQCAGSAASGGALENRVAAALWDLVDPASAEASGFDPARSMFAHIFGIFDEALDRAPYAGVATGCPTIGSFRAAWIGRTLDVVELDTVLVLNGIGTVSFPPSGALVCTSTDSGPAISASDNPVAGTGHITSGAVAKCLDVRNSAVADGTAVQIWTCHNTSAQQWLWSGQTLRALGKCLDVPNGATANGAQIQLWTCNGSGAQRWLRQADGTVRNPQSGRCLDLPSQADGTQVQLWDCHPGTGQRWDPSTYAGSRQLLRGQQLDTSTYLQSHDRRFNLVHQSDGNVVLYGPGYQALWSTYSWGQSTSRLILQTDGNAVLYHTDGRALWHTSTYGSTADVLVIQDDGNLVLYNPAGQALWHSGTGGR